MRIPLQTAAAAVRARSLLANVSHRRTRRRKRGDSCVCVCGRHANPGQRWRPKDRSSGTPRRDPVGVDVGRTRRHAENV